jgi:predicted TIM-barrel fold metal-dependent hydrolase
VPPPGACDCHFHVFGPYDGFPLAANRGYTPPEASIASYKNVMKTLGLERCVIVQPSVYGKDNAATLDAARALGAPRSCRIIAVIDESVDTATLRMLHDAGVRGVRFNLVAGGGPALERINLVARRIADFGWHVQIYGPNGVLAEVATTLRALPVDLVIDHFGSLDPKEDSLQPNFQMLLGLLREGRTWVKLSGGYISSHQEELWDDMALHARRLADARPDRLLWGTNWPHPVRYRAMPDDGDLLDALHEWLPDEECLRRILVENPKSLYGFH